MRARLRTGLKRWMDGRQKVSSVADEGEKAEEGNGARK